MTKRVLTKAARASAPINEVAIEPLASYGPLFVHKSVVDAQTRKELHQGAYCVSHEPTGYRIYDCANQQAARVVARILNETFGHHPDWVSADRHEVANIPAFKRSVMALRRTVPRNRGEAADVLAVVLQGAVSDHLELMMATDTVAEAV
jgi:hypothetical protein